MIVVHDALADPIPAACARMGISRSTAYLAIRAGRLRAVKAGGRTLILRVDQDAWAKSLPAIAAKRAA